MSKRNKTQRSSIDSGDQMFYTRQPAKAIEPFEPHTEKQKKYTAAIKSHIITFATGAAGTGRRMLPPHWLLKLLRTSGLKGSS